MLHAREEQQEKVHIILRNLGGDMIEEQKEPRQDRLSAQVSRSYRSIKPATSSDTGLRRRENAYINEVTIQNNARDGKVRPLGRVSCRS